MDGILAKFKRVHRNVIAVSLTSFFMDVSSEMIVGVLPLFMKNVLSMRGYTIGMVEGIATSLASLLKYVSGALSDRLKHRKWIAVGGYLLSALSKPFLAVAGAWPVLAAARWADRVGKGIRTAPRDALIAGSVKEEDRGFSFGLHRAADTAGAVVGIGTAVWITWHIEGTGRLLSAQAFRWIVAASVVPAFIAVAVLALLAREVPVPLRGESTSPASSGRMFRRFLVVSALFEVGNIPLAFWILRIQDAGSSVVGILGMVLLMHGVHAVSSLPAGELSDRLGRKALMSAGWVAYAVLALAAYLLPEGRYAWGLFCLYGLYLGLTEGTARAFIADLVPQASRGTAYGAYNALVGIMALPAAVIAGVLWEGIGGWRGFGIKFPFLFGACTSLLSVSLLLVWVRRK